MRYTVMSQRQVLSLLSGLAAATIAQAEFKKLSTSHQESCSISLAEAESLGLMPDCIAIFSEDPPLDFWKSRLTFNLGLLTEEQFIALHSRYSGWVCYHARQTQESVGISPRRCQVKTDLSDPNLNYAKPPRETANHAEESLAPVHETPRGDGRYKD